MLQIQRIAIDITPQRINKLGTWRKSHLNFVENHKTIFVKFRMIIFSTIMGSVNAVWPTKHISYQV